MGWAQISVITELMRPPPSAETKSVMMASPPHNVGVAHLHSEFALPLLNYDCLEQRDTSVYDPVCLTSRTPGKLRNCSAIESTLGRGARRSLICRRSSFGVVPC